MPGPQQLTLFGPEAEVRQPAGTRRLIQFGTRVVEYRFARSRRSTIGISVDADGLAVAAPYYAPWREVEKFLHEKAEWILAKLEYWSRAGRPLRIRGMHGEQIPVRGRMVALDVAEGRRRVELAGDRLMLRLQRPHEHARVSAEIVRWLKLHALETLAPRVYHYAALLDRPRPRVSVSNARTQWGACTEDGRIRLSWRLVHVPPDVADYVVAHEVAHLVELNHSPRFWNVVETLYPHCRAVRQQLDLAAAALPIF